MTFSRWFCCKQKAVQPSEEVYNEIQPTALLSIFFYFVQIPALLQVNLHYEQERDENIKDFGSDISRFFRFDALGYDDRCLIKDITPVEKTLYKILFIVFLFLALFIMYVMSVIFRALCRCGNFPKEGCGLFSLTNSSRFVGAFVLLVLYTYQFLSESVFMFLKCEYLHELGEDVLFIDGNYTCYANWQYMVLIAVGLYIVPLFFIVVTAPVLLKEQKINTLVFVLSLIFPLLALPFFFFLFIRVCSQGADDRGEKHSLKRFEATNFVAHLVIEPYKSNKMYWEGAIIFRRLVIIVIAIFVPSLIIRHVLLVVACLVAMVMHVQIQPFKKFSSNLLETISLLILLCIAVMNLLKAVYFDWGEIPKGSIDTLLQYYDIVEQAFVAFFPLLIIAVILLVVILRIIALPCDSMTRRQLYGVEEEPYSVKSRGSSQPSMENVPYNHMPGSATPAEGSQYPHQLAREVKYLPPAALANSFNKKF